MCSNTGMCATPWLPLLLVGFWLAGSAGAQPGAGWRSLFDGKSLDGWRETPFEGRGRVSVRDGHIVLSPGRPMTGIVWTRPFPAQGYEIRFQAARLEGSDFFASLTFPVRESHCTWIAGGWGGDIVGLSSLDGWDASENETRAYFTFENGRWYEFRLQVTGSRIRAWIDEEPVIDVKISEREVSLRPGPMEATVPLGFTSYLSSGGVRDIEYRLLDRR